MATYAQTERQRVRDRVTGRYEEVRRCEACGKSAPLDHGSRLVKDLIVCDESDAPCGPNGDLGLVVCFRKRCPASVLGDDEYAHFMLARYLNDPTDWDGPGINWAY
jgi:hypothetical protein